MENQATKRPMVLVVESDPLMLTAIASVLNSVGYRVVLAKSQLVAMKAAADAQFDLMVVSIDDNILQAAADTATLRASQSNASVPVIFLAPRLDTSWIEPLNKAGGVFCLTKPFDQEKLLELVEQASTLSHLSVARLAPPKAHFANEWVKLS